MAQGVRKTIVKKNLPSRFSHERPKHGDGYERKMSLYNEEGRDLLEENVTDKKNSDDLT